MVCKIWGSFLNLNVGLRILLIILVVTVSAGAGFPKLKLIKTKPITRITQERQSNLRLLLIEHKLCENLDYNNIVIDFTEMKTRK